MCRFLKKSLSLILVLLLFTAAAGCVFPQPQIVHVQPAENAIDLWTAPPDSEAPAAEDLYTAFPEATASPSSEPTPSPAPQRTDTPSPVPTPKPTDTPVREDGEYDQKDDVALYLHLFGHLPSNYITKKEAQSLGWPGGDLSPYAPGKCIGGDWFGNYERLLPVKKGRSYYECDIGTLNRRSRGAKRIIFSNDGLIYYTDDHYESFTLLYEGD